MILKWPESNMGWPLVSCLSLLKEENNKRSNGHGAASTSHFFPEGVGEGNAF